MRTSCCTPWTAQARITSPEVAAVGLAWVALLAFFRIGTGPSILPSPMVVDDATAGNLTSDAQLAAPAIEHGAEIVSYDRDFARFPGVRHRLPG